MAKYTIDAEVTGIVPHHPSTWPDFTNCDTEFMAVLRRIFDESILGEIDNVIRDAQQCNGNLDNRGYVVALALMCALDAISSYGYGSRRGAQIPEFIRAHLPRPYHRIATVIRNAYRDMQVHAWHLFAVGITADDAEAITWNSNGVPCIQILHLRDALRLGVEGYFEKLKTDRTLRSNTLRRYLELRRKAKRAW
jgi:hypothetical protein